MNCPRHSVPASLVEWVDREQRLALELLDRTAETVVLRRHPRESPAWRRPVARRLADLFAVRVWQISIKRVCQLRGLRSLRTLLDTDRPEVSELMGDLAKSLGEAP